MFQAWDFNLAKQISNFGRLVNDVFCATADSGMSTVHFAFKFRPMHVRFIFTGVVQVLESGFCLNCLVGMHAMTVEMMDESWPF